MLRILIFIAIIAGLGGFALLAANNKTQLAKQSNNTIRQVTLTPTITLTPTVAKVAPKITGPKSISPILTTIPTPKVTNTLNKPLFICSAEAQIKINAYSQQIKDEYEKCKSDTGSNMQSLRQSCQNNCDKIHQDEVSSCVTQSMAGLKPDGTSSFDLTACNSTSLSKYGSCSTGCLGLGFSDVNACQTTYQDKQKSVFSLMGQLCKFNP